MITKNVNKGDIIRKILSDNVGQKYYKEIVPIINCNINYEKKYVVFDDEEEDFILSNLEDTNFNSVLGWYIITVDKYNYRITYKIEKESLIECWRMIRLTKRNISL